MSDQTHLQELGFRRLKGVHSNLSSAALVEQALSRGEGILTRQGAFRSETGSRTGRSPNDKFIVKHEGLDEVWWGDVNRPFDPDRFDRIKEKVLQHYEGREAFVFDGFAGADPNHRLSVRIVTELAWHNLFARQLFIRPTPEQLADHTPGFTVISAPSLEADPDSDGTNSGAFILLSLRHRLVLVGGTYYAGEIKKSIFTVMNYLMPQQDVLPMHCSANIGDDGSTALFFGLSGTGKTTLSADPDRQLIGDDEHGWSDQGVFNFEGGCYAKCINLSQKNEPQIWEAIRFGSVLENVVVDPLTRAIDYDDSSLTENTRVAYPVEFIPGAVIPGVGGHPDTVVFLTADAFGVLPPIARLSRQQAMYHFISGYTSKLAGTEAGVTEPQATFSACFGAPFLPLHPQRYAEMLGERIDQHAARVYLVNTGWTGGPYGEGRRMDLPHTRAMVAAALNGSLEQASLTAHPVFGVEIPDSCPGVPDEVLNPRNTWQDKDAYDRKAAELAELFQRNMENFQVADAISAAGPVAV